MSSTFFGLSIASSGLNAFQAAINTTANNISNVNTKGYSKQTINLVASSALRAYQSYGSTGTGVSADSVTQVRDQYYDEKYWNNQSEYGQYEKKLYYMEQIENYFTDSSSTTGFSSIYSKMFNALDSLKANAGDTSYRNEFISKAQELVTYFNSAATQLNQLQSSVNDEVKTTVDSVNSIAQKISLINKQINVIEIQGGHANELRDQRNLLVDELSKIVPVEVKEAPVTNTNDPDMATGATYYTIKVDGVTLVDTYNYNTLSCVSRDERNNQSDIDGLYDVVWTQSGAVFDPAKSSMSGSLQALFEIRDGNNAENLTGKVSAVGNNTITLSKPSITDIENMNMPERGQITLNNTTYTYTNFTCNTDADGNITDYTFTLNKVLTSDEQAKLMGKTAEIGDGVNYMGIPYYMNEMNKFLRSFTKAFNDIQHTGVDMNGDQAGSFFVADNTFTQEEQDLTGEYKDGTIAALDNTYYRLTAGNVAIADAMSDPSKFSTATSIADGKDASDLVAKMAKLQSEEKLFRGGGGDTFLQCIYADITVDTEQCKLFKDNYKSIGTTIDNQRSSVSGVDEDEEALDLIKFQNAYNLASKCISVMSEMYDRLITQTGI